MLDVKTAKDILDRLRPPLSLRVMRDYFRAFGTNKSLNRRGASEHESMAIEADEDDFIKENHTQMSDSDTFAFTFLLDKFKERLRLLRTRDKISSLQAQMAKGNELGRDNRAP